MGNRAWYGFCEKRPVAAIGNVKRADPSPMGSHRENQPAGADQKWRAVKEGRRGRTRGTLKSGPAIKRANYPPSRECTPSNIFFLRSLREHTRGALERSHMRAAFRGGGRA